MPHAKRRSDTDDERGPRSTLGKRIRATHHELIPNHLFAIDSATPGHRVRPALQPRLMRETVSSRTRESLLHEPVSGTRPVGYLSQLALGLEPVPTVVAILCTSRLPEFKRAVGYFLFVHKYQMVLLKMREPFIPRDGAKSSECREVEPDADAPVVHVDSRRSRIRGFAGCGLGAMSPRPRADDFGIPGGDTSAASTRRLNLLSEQGHRPDARHEHI